MHRVEVVPDEQGRIIVELFGDKYHIVPVEAKKTPTGKQPAKPAAKPEPEASEK